MFNNVVQGWINYYGRFYKSGLYPLLRRINDVSRAMGQAEVQTAARPLPDGQNGGWCASRDAQPTLFAHWRLGVRPDGWTMGAG